MEKTEHDIKKEYVRIALDLKLVPIYMQGKKPFIPGWPNRTLEDAKKSFSKHKGWRAQYNIGIITGKKSNIIVIDVEAPDVENFIKIVNEFGGFPSTLTVCTGSKGCHFYFSYPNFTVHNAVRKVITSPSGLKSHFDIRSDRGVIVFAGSIHDKTGDRYEFDPSMYDYSTGTPLLIISDIPQWINKFL